jgi:predicted acyltransferase (DUF342 family)
MVLIKHHKKNTDVSVRNQTAFLYQDFRTDRLASRGSEPELSSATASPNELEETTQNSFADRTTIPSNDSLTSENDEIPDFPADIKGEVFTVGDNVTAIIGDLEIPSRTNTNELLVVKGNLKIGDRCRVSRKLKALGNITIGSETIIEDNLVSGGNVIIGSNSVIHGSIKAAGKIQFKGATFSGNDSSEESVVDTELLASVIPGNE